MTDVLEGLARMRGAGFGSAAEILLELADDPAISPELYDRICEAVFTVLNAWADAGVELEKWQAEHEATWNRLPPSVQTIYMREYRFVQGHIKGIT